MAKGNLFLGTAARSVGDVVMYRREGSQVSRVRVRKVANPKTDAQCKQRAYMAPIPKFFSPLAIVLERSFEGLSKAKSYAKFIKENANLARTNDWLLPKGTGFFPLPYKLSQGSLPAIAYTVTTDGGPITVDLGSQSGSINNIAQLSTAFISMGYKAGDVVTFVCVYKDAGNNYVPISAQFIIDTENTDTLSTISSALTVTVIGGESFELRISVIGHTTMAGAIIVARFENEKWRRSTQTLAVAGSITTEISAAAYKAAAIASYGNNAAGENPLVFLDGEDLA